MTKISDNPKRQNRILFTAVWMGLPTYMFIMTDFKLLFLVFIIPGAYWLVYLGTKLRDVYVTQDSVCLKDHKKTVVVPISEISSLTHYNRGVYKMCFHNKKLAGVYILFYGDTKRWLSKDGPFEHFYNQINT